MLLLPCCLRNAFVTVLSLLPPGSCKGCGKEFVCCLLPFVGRVCRDGVEQHRGRAALRAVNVGAEMTPLLLVPCLKEERTTSSAHPGWDSNPQSLTWRAGALSIGPLGPCKMTPNAPFRCVSCTRGAGSRRCSALLLTLILLLLPFPPARCCSRVQQQTELLQRRGDPMKHTQPAGSEHVFYLHLQTAVIQLSLVPSTAPTTFSYKGT